MKYLNALILLIFTLIFHQSYADEYTTIDRKIEQIRYQVKFHQSSTVDLLLLNKKLDSFIPELNQCIAIQNEKITDLKTEYQYLKDPQHRPYLMRSQKDYDAYLQRVGNSKEECGFLLVKIQNIQQQIYRFNAINFNHNLHVQQKPFWMIISTVSNFNYPYLRPGFIFEVLGRNTAFFRNNEMGMIFLFSLIILKLLSFSSINFFKKFQSIKFYRVICILLVFCITLPVPLILLKLLYKNSDLTLVDFFSHDLYVFISASILFYLYRHYEIRNYFKETILLIVSLLLYGSMLRLCFGMFFFQLHGIEPEKILLIKYFLLIQLQIVLLFLIYWVWYRILQYKISKNILISLLFLQLLMFITGLSGYVDRIFDVEMTCMIAFVLSIWCILLNRLVHFFIDNLINKTTMGHLFIEKHLAFFSEKAVLSSNFMIKFIYYIAIVQIFFVILSLFPFLLSNDHLKYISSLIYGDLSFNGMNFKLINFYQAILLFQMINLFSYFLAIFLAKAWLSKEDSIQKTAKIIHWFCFLFNFIIAMMISGLQLSSFIILFGSLSFGIGLGLKNILSSIISSIILFVNRPFEIGDYVEINVESNQTKGFVKNITLFETLIETLDKNILIFPNDLVASSVIQNMTYANKSSQNIHLSYILNHSDFEQEELVKTSLLSLFQDNPNILVDQYNGVQFIFSPLTQTSDDTRLEIIFSVKTLKNIQENLSIVNRQTLIKLKTLNLDVKFENMLQPF